MTEENCASTDAEEAEELTHPTGFFVHLRAVL
jgi:hypothetical protein